MRLRKKNDGILDEEVELIAKVSDALAHPVRVNLVRYIMQKNKVFEKVCTKDLVEEFDYAQATISQHMKKLVQSGLVQTKSEEKFTYFYINLGMLMKYVNATKKFVNN